MYGTLRAGSSTSTSLSSSSLHASNGAPTQEQASADLVLLQQELGKSQRVTGRMATLLTSFDDRLARLDKSVVPIHRNTKDLGKIQRNIEAALLAIEAVVGTNDLVDREQEVIDRLPRDDLQGYQASLSRLKQAAESMEKSAASSLAGQPGLMAGSNKGKEREGTLGRVRALIERGCQRLGDLFLDTVQAASPATGWADIGSWDQGTAVPALMDSGTVDQLVSLLAFLQHILGQGSAVEKDLQKGYGEIRGLFTATTLNYVGREATDGVEVQTRSGGGAGGRLPALGRRGFGRFIDAMFAMAKSEHALIGSIFGKHTANQIYRHIVPTTLTVLTATGTAINAAVKKTLTSNATSVGIAFTCYVELTMPNRIDNFEDWIRSKGGRKDNEFSQLSHAFKGSCLRSLPEFLEDTKAYGNKVLASPEQTSASISITTVNLVNFAKQLCEFPDTVEQFLQTLGEGNWLPGGNGMSSKSSVLSSGGEFVLTSKYLTDMVQILLQALDSRARALSSVRTNQGGSHGPSSVLKKDKDHHPAHHGNRQSAGIAAVFMLNNISFIRRELLLNSNVPDLLAGGGAPSRRDSSSTTATGNGASAGDANIEDELNKRNRSAKTSYLEIFSPLVSCLMDAGVEHSALKSAIGVGNTEKKDTKDRFVRFNEALEEIESLHKLARLDKNEESLRERVKDEVIRMCVPTYTRFVQRHENFSKNPGKYLKVDPDGLEARLGALFR